MRIRYSFSSRKTGQIIGTNAHAKPVPHLVKEVIRISDIVLEVVDARFIEKTRNREMEDLVKESGKHLIIVINKTDLVDLEALKMNTDLKELEPYILFSCKQRAAARILRTRIKIEVKKVKMPVEKRAQVGIIGYPNTGKSSLINLLIGRKSTGVSPQSGFTRAMQKIRLTKDLMLIDSPGVFTSNEELPTNIPSMKKLAEIGVKNYDKVKEPDMIVSHLMKLYPLVFERYYKIEANGDAEVLMEEVGKRMNFIKKGSAIDTDRAARFILRDWQDGKIKHQSKQI